MVAAAAGILVVRAEQAPAFILPEENGNQADLQFKCDPRGDPFRRVFFRSSERKAADQLNLACGAGSGQNLAGVSG